MSSTSDETHRFGYPADANARVHKRVRAYYVIWIPMALVMSAGGVALTVCGAMSGLFAGVFIAMPLLWIVGVAVGVGGDQRKAARIHRTRIEYDGRRLRCFDEFGTCTATIDTGEEFKSTWSNDYLGTDMLTVRQGLERIRMTGYLENMVYVASFVVKNPIPKWEA